MIGCMKRCTTPWGSCSEPSNRNQIQKKRMEREEEEARLKQVPWIQRVFGAKPPTKEDLMKMAEIELENKTRYSCIWGLGFRV